MSSRRVKCWTRSCGSDFHIHTRPAKRAPVIHSSRSCFATRLNFMHWAPPHASMVIASEVSRPARAGRAVARGVAGQGCPSWRDTRLYPLPSAGSLSAFPSAPGDQLVPGSSPSRSHPSRLRIRSIEARAGPRSSTDPGQFWPTGERVGPFAAQTGKPKSIRICPLE